MAKYEYLLYNALKKSGRKNKSFHMPGHKSRGDFKRKFKCCPADITELSYSDNLASPSGAIKAAQNGLAEICGAYKSFILTDGSTQGVFAMVACAGRGKKLIVPRNCHKSVWNACALCGVEPVVLRGEIKQDVMLPPSPADVADILKTQENVAGMLALSPDYFGNVAPLEEYAKVLHGSGKLLFCDGAHGAHLAFERENAAYAGLYCDMWVDGAHKTLPTLTQGALLNVNNSNLAARAESAARTFGTTSPSYPVMASVEYGYKYLADNPRKILKAKIAAQKFVRGSDYAFYESGDWAKIVLDLKGLDICADKAAQQLEKRGIYSELSNGRYILFYVSPAVKTRDFKKLKRALDGVLKDGALAGTYKEQPEFINCEKSCGFLKAVYGQSELVPLDAAEGRICAQGAGIMPPCIPIAVAGEVITRQAIELLKSGAPTFGITDGKIAVLKGEYE